tara:strand:- start:100 stop:984 length:885 start_codon:yes stop_codon:yes gene_type:complete
MKGYVFPGQGAQYPGMGKDIYDKSSEAKKMFHQANEILNFDITSIMFGEDAEKLKQTKVTQPAIFIHSVILAHVLGDSFNPDMVAGHSLGEFSALTASKYISFEDGLLLVSKRAFAMQSACEKNPSTMAAILGLDDHIVEDVCNSIKNEIVVPANYNCPGQIVISGTNTGIKLACKKLLDEGAKRALQLPVGGAFHSPLMRSAQDELEKAINNTIFRNGLCPIYQNVATESTSDPKLIKENLKKQLTSSVMWTQSMKQMIADGLSSVTEVGPGKVLQGLFKKIDRSLPTQSAFL